MLNFVIISWVGLDVSCEFFFCLFVVDNGIGPAGAIGLSAFVSCNTTLKELYLGENFIGDKGISVICHALMSNTSLAVFDLSCMIHVVMKRRYEKEKRREEKRIVSFQIILLETVYLT